MAALLQDIKYEKLIDESALVSTRSPYWDYFFKKKTNI